MRPAAVARPAVIDGFGAKSTRRSAITNIASVPTCEAKWQSAATGISGSAARAAAAAAAFELGLH